MPELPDIELYRAAISERTVGRELSALRLGSPFVLRSVAPLAEELVGRRVASIQRLGKRIVFYLEDEFFIVVHLMVAGRFAWYDRGGPREVALRARNRLAAFDFAAPGVEQATERSADGPAPVGTLLLTEAGKKRRAAIHLVRGTESLQAFDRGGLEILESSFEQFDERLRSENHTLKRTLADPRLFSGVGNAYSDEILHRAGLSPLRWSTRLDEEQSLRLFAAAQEVLVEWTELLRLETASAFPKKVTAFRPEMAVHGKFREPCPVCGAPVQRIVYAANECNYCAGCQTGGKILADRALSRLLRGDWPKSLQELEERSAAPSAR